MREHVPHHPSEVVSQPDAWRHRMTMEVCIRIFEELEILPEGEPGLHAQGMLPGYQALVKRLHMTPRSETEQRAFAREVYSDPATEPPFTEASLRLVDMRVRYYHMDRYLQKREAMRRHPSFQEPDAPDRDDPLAA